MGCHVPRKGSPNRHGWYAPKHLFGMFHAIAGISMRMRGVLLHVLEGASYWWKGTVRLEGSWSRSRGRFGLWGLCP